MVEPVPPFATPRVPESVSVPKVVIGPPENESPVVPPDASTDVTEPAPNPRVEVARRSYPPRELPTRILPYEGVVDVPVPPEVIASGLPRVRPPARIAFPVLLTLKSVVVAVPAEEDAIWKSVVGVPFALVDVAKMVRSANGDVVPIPTRPLFFTMKRSPPAVLLEESLKRSSDVPLFDTSREAPALRPPYPSPPIPTWP